MKQLSGWIVAIMLAAGHQSTPAANLPGESTHPQGLKIYLRAEGPDPLVKRFAKFLDIALEDHGFRRVNTPGEADRELLVSISERPGEESLFGDFMEADLVLKDGSPLKLKSCQRIVESFDTTSLDSLSIPYDWRKQHSSISTYYMGASGKEAEAFAKGMSFTGYRPASRKDADIIVKRLNVRRALMSGSAIQQRVKVELSKSDYILSERTLYQSVQAKDDDAKICTEMIDGFMQNSYSKEDRFWTAASAAIEALVKQPHAH